MPLVRIDLPRGADRRAVSEAVHAALVETIGIPPQDRFQVIREHGGAELFVEITISFGRTVEQRRAIFEHIAARCPEARVAVVETERANWSFGNGLAQYAVAPG